MGGGGGGATARKRSLARTVTRIRAKGTRAVMARRIGKIAVKKLGKKK